VAFPADLGGVCRKRLFSLSLEPAYSGLQGYMALSRITPNDNFPCGAIRYAIAPYELHLTALDKKLAVKL
jgi:hypothetical protein